MTRAYGAWHPSDMGESSVASRVAFVLRYCGLTQAAFAELAGVSKVYLSETSRGVNAGRRPRLAVLARVADAAGVPYSWLAFGEGATPDGEAIRSHVRAGAAAHAHVER